MSLLDMSRGLRIPAPHPPKRGVFISFEGGEAAGKTTQMQMLWDHLVTERFVAEDLILTTREPGGTELGASIRELLLHGEHVDPRAEALLYAADRAHHIATLVRPHLARGGLVLGDRYLDSSIAYQGAGRSLEPDEIGSLSLWAADGLLPHRTILLDVPTACPRRAPGLRGPRSSGEGGPGLPCHGAPGVPGPRRRRSRALRRHRRHPAARTGPRPGARGRQRGAGHLDPTFEPAPPTKHRDEM